MSATETFRRQFSVGRYQVTVSAQLVSGKAVGLQTEWEPSIPRRLSPVLLKTYQQKRNHACAVLAARLGGPVAMVDNFGSGRPVTLTAIFPDGHTEIFSAEGRQS